MDIISLALAKKFALRVAAGFSNVEVDGMNIIFTLNDNTEVTLTVPTPENGVSVTDLNINDQHLICTLSNGTVVDAGQIPMPQRGTDYWTEADRTAIKNYVDESMSDAFRIEQDNENNALIFKRIGSE